MILLKVRACLVILAIPLLISGCLPKREAQTGEGPPSPPARFESVTINGLNLRAQPSAKANVIDSLARGDTVEVLGRSGNWILVRTSEDEEGYVFGAYLTGFDIAPPHSRQPQSKAPKPKDDQVEPEMLDSDDIHDEDSGGKPTAKE